MVAEHWYRIDSSQKIHTPDTYCSLTVSKTWTPLSSEKDCNCLKALPSWIKNGTHPSTSCKSRVNQVGHPYPLRLDQILFQNIPTDFAPQNHFPWFSRRFFQSVIWKLKLFTGNSPANIWKYKIFIRNVLKIDSLNIHYSNFT